LLPTVIYYLALYKLGNPEGNIDTPGVIGSYLGLAFLGGIYCAIGIMASSVTPNQIVSFIVSAFLCFLFFTGFDSISTLDMFSNHVLTVRQFGIAYHYDSMSRGLLDIRDIVYFLSVTWLVLFATRIILKSRLW